MDPTLIIAIAVGVVLLFLVFTYNSLIAAKNQVVKSFSSVDVMLKKRADLIPNLVATVKQYMTHEADVLKSITELRNKVVNVDAADSQERFALENQLSSAMGGLRVSMEAYPDLKSNTNFIQLQASLNEVEEQISAARRAFNASVNNYNNKVEMLPSNIVAKMMGYKTKSSFEASTEDRKNVEVGNLFDS